MVTCALAVLTPGVLRGPGSQARSSSGPLPPLCGSTLLAAQPLSRSKVTRASRACRRPCAPPRPPPLPLDYLRWRSCASRPHCLSSQRRPLSGVTQAPSPCTGGARAPSGGYTPALWSSPIEQALGLPLLLLTSHTPPQIASPPPTLPPQLPSTHLPSTPPLHTSPPHLASPPHLTSTPRFPYPVGGVDTRWLTLSQSHRTHKPNTSPVCAHRP